MRVRITTRVLMMVVAVVAIGMALQRAYRYRQLSVSYRYLSHDQKTLEEFMWNEAALVEQWMLKERRKAVEARKRGDLDMAEIHEANAESWKLMAAECRKDARDAAAARAVYERVARRPWTRVPPKLLQPWEIDVERGIGRIP